MYLKRLKDLREDHDLTQEQLSKMLNISQRTYSYYETGGRSVPVEIICDLANIYQTSTDYILGLTDNKKDKKKKHLKID
ncbi:MAG TPA: helix-turn-helix transcriptional regulator [Mollicutes bacterium]|nr:helix-turn-helix transcriptional regulator [Mollicutes bacterium]